VIRTYPFFQQLNISCISPTVPGNPPPRPILPKNLGKSKTVIRPFRFLGWRFMHIRIGRLRDNWQCKWRSMRCWQACHVSIRLTLTKRKKNWSENLQEASMVPLQQTTWTKQANRRRSKAKTCKWIRNMHNKKKSNYNMNQKGKKGGQSYNHCGLYNFKNQKLGSRARVHHLEDWRFWPW